MHKTRHFPYTIPNILYQFFMTYDCMPYPTATFKQIQICKKKCYLTLSYLQTTFVQFKTINGRVQIQLPSVDRVKWKNKLMSFYTSSSSSTLIEFSNIIQQNAKYSPTLYFALWWKSSVSPDFKCSQFQYKLHILFL